MESTESPRFEVVRSYLWASDDERRQRPELAESWDWFRRRYRTVIACCARRLPWLEREDREHELWLFLIPRLRDLNYDARRGPLDACIALLARHAVSDARRAARLRRQEPSTEEPPANLVGPDVDPHAALVARERGRAVQDAIDAMRHGGASQDAWLLERYWFEDATLADIAAELDRPSAQVRVRHGRAREKLRAALLRGGRRDLLPGQFSASAPSENF